MAVRQWKFRTVHNRSRAPLRRSRLICCAIATSALPRTKTAPRDPILPSFSTCRYLGVGPFIPLSSFPFPHYRFPDPVASLSIFFFLCLSSPFPIHPPLDLRVTSVRESCLFLTPFSPIPPLFLAAPASRKIQPVHKERRINTVECKIKFIPLQVSVISLASRDSCIFVAVANPRDFDLFPDN